MLDTCSKVWPFIIVNVRPIVEVFTIVSPDNITNLLAVLFAPVPLIYKEAVLLVEPYEIVPLISIFLVKLVSLLTSK